MLKWTAFISQYSLRDFYLSNGAWCDKHFKKLGFFKIPSILLERHVIKMPCPLLAFTLKAWKASLWRVQWMFRKTLLQASGYFCTISELTGLSHQCQISMFSFFLISVIHWYKHSTDFTTSLCLWIEMSYWFPVLIFAVLKIAWLFASQFFSFQTSLRI